MLFTYNVYMLFTYNVYKFHPNAIQYILHTILQSNLFYKAHI